MSATARLVLVALLVPAAIACGGSGDTGARSASRAVPSPAAQDGPPGTTAQGGGSVPAGATSAPAAAPIAPGEAGARTTATPSAPPANARSSRATPSGLPDDAPLAVRVLSDCVVPGGTQRVVVDTLPDAYLAYDNLYADSRDGAVHGGIDGQARSDGRGHFEASWVVSPTAPVGDVRLDVGASAQGRGSVRMVFYRVASSCP